MPQKVNIPHLRLDEVTAIQRTLESAWGIKSPRTATDWTDQLNSLPQEIKKKYQSLHDEQLRYAEKGRSIPADLERHWYELLGKQPLAGVVHSRKYPFILDSAAAVISICRESVTGGPILDIGCHIGYHLDIYEQLVGAEVIGIELSASAVVTAQESFKSRSRISVIQGDISKLSIPKCKLITCVDAFPIERTGMTVFLKRIVQAIPEDGMIILAGALAAIPRGDVAKACKHVGLGMLLHDVIGGWMGDLNDYQGGALLVLGRGGLPVPRDLHIEWTEGFPEYANSPSTPWHEKTQAFFRSRKSNFV